jgi:hypothetical protein
MCLFAAMTCVVCYSSFLCLCGFCRFKHSITALCSLGCMHGVCAGDIDFWYVITDLLLCIALTDYLFQHSVCYPGIQQQKDCRCTVLIGVLCCADCAFAGWEGDSCNTAVCKAGCDPRGGGCLIPDTCECAVGFTGDLCTIGTTSHSVLSVT